MDDVGKMAAFSAVGKAGGARSLQNGVTTVIEYDGSEITANVINIRE